MDREQAIKELQESHDIMRNHDIDESESYLMQALNMAIKALEQEPKYCDRNICLRNEYNGIGCDECEVGNPCLYCKHEFEPQERSE